MSNYTPSLPSPSGRSRRRWGTLAAATALAASGLAASTAAGASTAPTVPSQPAGTEAEGTVDLGTGPGGSLPGAGIDISFIQGVKGDEFYISMECGVQDAAAEFGATVNVQGPDSFDATLQNPIIDAVVASKPDAILVAPNDVEASAGPLQRAQDAGIKVILVDTVGQRHLDRRVAHRLGQLPGRRGGGRCTRRPDRRDGHGDGGQRQPGHLHHRPAPGRVRAGDRHATRTSSTSAPSSASNDPAKAAEIVTAAIAAHPDLNGVFAANLFSAEGTATGVQQANADVKVVGFDAGPAQVDQLKAGDVQALVVQKPYDIGYQGVEQAILAVNGGAVTPEISTDFVVATPDNLDDPDISKFLYKANCD